MKPSQKRKAIVEEFIKAWTRDDGLLEVSKYDHKELADHLTQALNDYTQSIIEMVEGMESDTGKYYQEDIDQLLAELNK